MPSNYTGNAGSVTPRAAVIVAEPVDGDVFNSALVNAPLTTLTDVAAHLETKAALLDQTNAFTGTNTFSTAPGSSTGAARKAEVDAKKTAVLYFGNNAVPNGGGANHVLTPGWSDAAPHSTTGIYGVITIPFGGVVRNLTLWVFDPFNGANQTAVLWKGTDFSNIAPTVPALTATAVDAATGTGTKVVDSTHVATVAAGDLIAINISNNGAAVGPAWVSVELNSA